MNIFPKKQTSVDEIVGELNTAVIKLQNLEEEKQIEVANKKQEIITLTAEFEAAEAERCRAGKVAGNIIKLIEG